jgi:hypothetical protein
MIDSVPHKLLRETFCHNWDSGVSCEAIELGLDAKDLRAISVLSDLSTAARCTLRSLADSNAVNLDRSDLELRMSLRPRNVVLGMIGAFVDGAPYEDTLLTGMRRTGPLMRN